jgi:aminopeptidase N
MFASIAAFELRYQLKNPVFWVVGILFFLLTFGAVTVEEIQIGSGGNVKVNAPFAIVQIHLVLSLFFMFVTTAFVANVVVRDDESGFGPMVRSPRVSKFDYLMARFLGAFAAAAMAFLAVPLAILVGSAMPWLDPETVGPNRLADYAFAYGVLALPNLFITSAIFFCVATLTRSMLYSYLGVVVFLVAYVVVISLLRSQPELRDLGALVEPFGFAGFGNATRYWTAAEQNGLTPPLTGSLLANRAIWIGIGLLAVGIAFARFRFGEKGLSSKAAARAARKEAKLATVAPVIVERLPATDQAGAAVARLMARTRFEMALLFRSPAFLVLVLAGLFNAVGALWFANELYDTPSRPATFALIETLFGAFGIIPVIIAIYYSGELVWRDRERKFHEIIDSTPLPGWTYLVPKVIAVAAVLMATLAAGMLAAVVIQLLRGFTAINFGQYLMWYLLPGTADMLLLAVLAVFVQALSPNKYVGWAVMVVYLVATITLSNIGFEHPLYIYGDTPSVRFSDMNGDQIGGAAAWWLRLYWGAVALVLAVLAHLLWRRGTEVRLAPRLRRLPAGLMGTPGLIAGLALVTAAASGAFIFWNTNVLNTYRTSKDVELLQAEREKAYLKFETLAQPVPTDIRLAVDLYPAERRVEVQGLVMLKNVDTVPIETVHLRLDDPRIELLSVGLPGARLETDDKRLGYRIYRLATPLAPGDAMRVDFRSRRWQRGFPASGQDVALVANGSFLNNGDFMPQIGMDRSGLLSDRATRRKYGLPAELRPAKLEDLSAQKSPYVASARWVSAEIKVSTDAGQVPLAPGIRVSDVTAGGRRTSTFVSKGPILSFFSVQSADYAEKTMDADGVKLSVFHDRRHDWNVQKMLDAMKVSLGCYRANFGPYQFDHARVVEFPGYASFAQAFAGTMPYSEGIGFLADNGDADSIDYVTYVTAHEVAHQYWAHQLLGAGMQGGTMLSETLAQYSALMVMKQLYGPDKIRRFLKFELDSYLSARGSEAIEEVPLNRVEGQGYIHYRKGSVVMYLLADRLGEARVNAMLAGLLRDYRFKGAPYPRSTVLVDGLKALARDDAERQLVVDLVERITIFDLKTKTAVVRQLPDKRFETLLTVEAGKAYADGQGRETAADLSDAIDIGVFVKRPGRDTFGKADVLLMERRPVKSGVQEIRVVTKAAPVFAGVDPYNKYVDRNSDDNVIEVTTES